MSEAINLVDRAKERVLAAIARGTDADYHAALKEFRARVDAELDNLARNTARAVRRDMRQRFGRRYPWECWT